MSEISEEPHGTNQLLDEATLWFARMRGPEADAHRPAFEAWLARGALHRRAYNHAAEIFSFGKFLTEEARVPADAAKQFPTSSTRPWLLASLIFGCAALVGLGCSLLVGRPDGVQSASVPANGPPLEGVLQTAAGKGRVERLADGSILTLGPNTRLAMRYDGARRMLVLIKGRARFEVAKERRPFVVTALGTRITAHGTVFDVAIGAKSAVTVSLIEGRIEVAAPPRAGRPPLRRSLFPGQSVEVAAESAQAKPAADGGTAQSGYLATQETPHEYDAARLADIVAEANRVGAIPITLEKAALGELRISGRFRLRDSAKLAERIAAVFNLSVDRTSPRFIMLRQR